MAIKNISQTDEKNIIRVLRKWNSGRKLTWELLREAISKENKYSLNKVWSRQSFCNNKPIHDAYVTAKKRIVKNRLTPHSKNKTNEQYEKIIHGLEDAIGELQIKYDRLLIRHTQLAYNASQLEHGNHLLSDPLPDNTRSQEG